MGTRNNPDPPELNYIAKAEDDEPVFPLLGRDPLGAEFVMLWVALRNKDDHGARRLFERMIDRANAQPYRPLQGAKLANAVNVSAQMTAFRATRRERQP